MNIKQFFSKVLDYCVETGEPLDTRNVIDVAVRNLVMKLLSTSLIIMLYIINQDGIYLN